MKQYFVNIQQVALDKEEKKCEPQNYPSWLRVWIVFSYFFIIRTHIKYPLLKERKFFWVWWCAPITPALGRLRQEDHCEFDANLDCKESLRPPWTAKQDSVSTKERKYLLESQFVGFESIVSSLRDRASWQKGIAEKEEHIPCQWESDSDWGRREGENRLREERRRE